jgi:hypothetical protein
MSVSQKDRDMGIIRTIPADEQRQWVERLFDGSIDRTGFPLPRVPRRNIRGDWLNVNYQGTIRGRCRIVEVEIGADHDTRDVRVGSQGLRHAINARCNLVVECPGERAPGIIPCTLRRGFKYCDALW